MTLRVECYAGYRGEEEPHRFWLGSRAVEVREVVDRWHGPDHRYFKLRGSDLGLYLLRHDLGADAWELVRFEAPPRL